MDLSRHSQQLLQQLEATAASSTPKAQEVARNLALALDPATRIMLVEALSDAAAEISDQLAPGGVDLRVRGTAVNFVVTTPDAAPQAHSAAHAEAASVGADTPRTTLRIPDGLKQRAEQAAAAEGMSLNAWLVRAVSLSLEPGPRSRRGRASARFAGWADQQD